MEELLAKAMLLGIWIPICILSGAYDGFMYSLADTSKLEKLRGHHPHPHDIATGLRVVVAAGLSGLSGFHTPLNLSLATLSLGMVFSFWHNGFYYQFRGALDMPEYNFFSKSKTSTSWKVKLFGRIYQPFEFSFWQRTILMILGIILLYLI